MEGSASDHSAHDAGRQELAEVSDEMVRLYGELFGRQPAQAVTHYAGPDAVICTLGSSFTAGERLLVKMGEEQRLRATRPFLQIATKDAFVAAVELITSRKVRGSLSGCDVRRDISSEVFYLEAEVAQ